MSTETRWPYAVPRDAIPALIAEGRAAGHDVTVTLVVHAIAECACGWETRHGNKKAATGAGIRHLQAVTG